MNKIKISDIDSLVKSKIFTIKSYPKKDGTSRDINARLHVKKHLKGGTWLGTVGKHFPIYDMQNRQYKMLIIDNMQNLTLKVNNTEYLLTID